MKRAGADPAWSGSICPNGLKKMPAAAFLSIRARCRALAGPWNRILFGPLQIPPRKRNIKNRGAYKPPCPGRKGITPRIKGEPSNGENPQKAKSESIGFRKRRPARPFLPAAHGGSRRGGQKRRAMAEGPRQAQFCPAEALCRIPPPNPCRMSGSFYRYSACLCSGDLCRRPRICGSARGLGGSRRGC